MPVIQSIKNKVASFPIVYLIKRKVAGTPISGTKKSIGIKISIIEQGALARVAWRSAPGSGWWFVPPFRWLSALPLVGARIWLKVAAMFFLFQILINIVLMACQPLFCTVLIILCRFVDV